MIRGKMLIVSVLVLCVSLAGPAWAQKSTCGTDPRASSDCYGVSGGNVLDKSKLYCCSGTLGSLVKDSAGVLYILSNNHVLGRSGKAVAGEDISQPGMVDLKCAVNEIVADFTKAPSLKNNVDAAIAALRSNAMLATGEIMGIGIPSANVKAPALGLSVTKHGRTTGKTDGTVTSINTTVRVGYSKTCGAPATTSYTFKNQIVTTNMSAGGDSGSLTVTADPCHQPVGLLFAGSTTATIHNPIGEVLDKVGAALGKSVEFVGTTCPSETATQTTEPAPHEIQYVSELVRGHAEALMANPAVIGVGVAAADDNPSEAVMAIYVERRAGGPPALPERVAAARVKIIPTESIVALGCCQACQAGK